MKTLDAAAFTNMMTIWIQQDRINAVQYTNATGVWDPQKRKEEWAFSSEHRGGANFLYGDGHAEFLSENIDYPLLARLVSPCDGHASTEDQTQ